MLVIQSMSEQNFLNANLVLGLRQWSRNYQQGKFNQYRRDPREEISKIACMLYGFENPQGLAKAWKNYDGQSPETIDPDSEVGLRARLSEEMALCIERGGVITSSGQRESNLPRLVEETIYQVRPEIKEEVAHELLRQENESRPYVEGTVNKT
jgi:hypothetical protein